MSKQIFNIGANTPVIDTSANTAARTYTMQDRDGTVADLVDVQAAEDAAKAYADGLVVGLLDDRGNYDASVNTFPASGGSGIAGAVKKGDLWRISVAGTLGGVYVSVDDWVRALADAPGQTAASWAIARSEASNEGVVASLSSSSGVVTIDCSGAKQRTLALTENVTSWSPTNLPAAGTVIKIGVEIAQHASAAKTVAWTGLGTVLWAGGAPTVSTVTGIKQMFEFWFYSDGTVRSFYGAPFA